jgi:hypothetical protein
MLPSMLPLPSHLTLGHLRCQVYLLDSRWVECMWDKCPTCGQLLQLIKGSNFPPFAHRSSKREKERREERKEKRREEKREEKKGKREERKI